jgi:tRNA(Ile)-lysidine synthetase-like protein
MPLLRTLNPSVEATVVRFARLAAEDDDCLSDSAHRALKRLARNEPEGLRLSVVALGRLAAPVRRRLYLAAWRAVGADPAALEARHLETVEELLREGRPQRRAPIPGPAGFARCWNDLWVLRAGAEVVPDRPIALPGPGRAALGILNVCAVWGARPVGVPAVLIPSQRPVGQLILRPRAPGDRLGGRKVKDLLMEARLPVWRRARTLVVEDEAGIFGLLGPGVAQGLATVDPPARNQAIWLEEPGEKRWCP